MAPNPAMIKRSLRNIQSELEFLADTDVLSQEHLAIILANLPDTNSLPTASARRQNAAPPVQPIPSPQPPIQSFETLNVGALPPKTDYYAPSPAPSTGPQPPAYRQDPQRPRPEIVAYVTGKHAYPVPNQGPVDSGDLEFVAGERIAVTHYPNSDWWAGRSERTGKQGIFPRGFIENFQLVDERFPPPSAGPEPSKETDYGNMPLAVANGDPGRVQSPSKTQEMGKKFGKKMGNAAIFGAGATIGSNIVNSIF